MERVKMEIMRRRATSNTGMEENTLAILDSFCSSDSSHVHDDRLAFLDAVRSASIVPQNGTPPTNKMMEAVFEIMRESKSLELIMASYQLLCELEKQFPRVYLFNEEGCPIKKSELVVIEEAWSPFAVGSDVASGDKYATSKGSKEPIDAAEFNLLLAGLTEVAAETETSKLELVTNMVLFQYLVVILEGDFSPRKHAFLENSNWICLRDSFLNKLLGSRRINYKGLVKDCLYTLSNSSTRLDHDSKPDEGTSLKMSYVGDLALALSLPEVEKSSCKALLKLLAMMIELDSARKKADTQGLTTRVDGVRTPTVELILDELSYDKDMISPFLQAFDDPKLKLEIVSQYLQKYTAKPSTRNRRSNGSQDDAVITGIFKCFSSSTSTKGIVKKISADAVQVLLAHALQACMVIPKEQLLEGISGLKEDAESSPLLMICQNIISAFTRLRETDEHLQILAIGKEALFTAATILSTRS